MILGLPCRSGAESLKPGKQDERDKQIHILVKGLAEDLLVSGQIKSIRFEGDFLPCYFPLDGLFCRDNNVYQVSKQFTRDVQMLL